MMKRWWVRFAMVTTLAVGATLFGSAGPAEALPRKCDALFADLDYAWDQFNNYMAEASINLHDGNWDDYVENVEAATRFATDAKTIAGLLQKGKCY